MRVMTGRIVPLTAEEKEARKRRREAESHRLLRQKRKREASGAGAGSLPLCMQVSDVPPEMVSQRGGGELRNGKSRQLGTINLDHSILCGFRLVRSTLPAVHSKAIMKRAVPWRSVNPLCADALSGVPGCVHGMQAVACRRFWPWAQRPMALGARGACRSRCWCTWWRARAGGS